MTFRGYWALCTIIICTIASILFASKSLFLISVFLLGLLTFSAINIFYRKSKIKVLRETIPKYPVEDSEVLTTLSIEGALKDTLIKDYFDSGKKSTKFYFDKTSSKSSTKVQYKLNVEHRGKYTQGPLLVTENDWLGFFSKDTPIDNEEFLLVYPKVEEIAIPTVSIQSQHESKSFKDNSTTPSEDLFGLKEYSPGDDTRLIHWKTSSRTNKLYVRHSEQLAIESNSIILDLNINSYDVGEFEPAVRLCASFCHASESSNKKTVFLGTDDKDRIYDERVFLDKLCDQQLIEDTTHIDQLNDLNPALATNVFIITGSKAIINTTNNIVFRISNEHTSNLGGINEFSFNADRVFEDYRQWVEKWNVREALA